MNNTYAMLRRGLGPLGALFLAWFGTAQAQVASAPAGAPAAESAAAGQSDWKSLLRSDFNLDAAVQRVCHRLMKPEPGTFFHVRKAWDEQRYHEKAEFEQFKAYNRVDQELGSFTRMRVYTDEHSVLDLALRLEGGRIAACEPIRPVVLNGEGFFEFPGMLPRLADADPGDYAAGLGRLFESFEYLDEALGSEPEEPPPSADKIEALKAWITESRPAPAAGTPMPAFQVLDEKGVSLSPERLSGKRALLFFGMVNFDDHRQAMAHVQKYARSRPGTTLVQVMSNDSDELASFRRRGQVFEGIAVNDAAGTVHDAFRVAFMPCVYAYDKSGKFVKLVGPPFQNYEELAKALDRP
jgi:hypothetical protein